MVILEEETFKQFGYYSTDLAPQSNKRIIAQCDECDKIRIIRKRSYRDLCVSCSERGERHHLFGKHMPQETKRKLSEAKKGRKHTEESKRKISESTKGERNHGYGKHLSKEHKKKIGDGNIGTNTGKNNWNWKGGISFEPYCKRFNNELKEKIREKYNRKCYLCGKSEEEIGQHLDVHHVDKDKMQGCNDKTWFLIPLCRSCHMQIHMKEKTKRGKKKNQILYIQPLSY